MYNTEPSTFNFCNELYISEEESGVMDCEKPAEKEKMKIKIMTSPLCI